MSVQVRRRREAASFLASFVGAQGELIVDTTSNRVQVHDGATPGGFPAAKLAEVITNTRTVVADAGYTALPSDRTIAFTAITAPRTVTLPAASLYPTGTQLLVVDEAGACSATVTITLARVGADLINGASGAVVATPYGCIALESNGVAKWTIVAQMAVAIPSIPTFQNLRIANGATPNSQVVISADRLTLVGSSNALLASSVSVVCSTTTIGANGLDAGPVAASTGYYVFVISNGTTTAGLLSTSATAPALPSGYTYKLRVGWQVTDAAGNLRRITQVGRRAQYVVTASTNTANLPQAASATGVVGAVATPTYVAIPLAAFVPATASVVLGSLFGAGGVTAALAPNSSYGAYNSAANPPPVTVNQANFSVAAFNVVLESGSLYWATTASAGVSVLGWEDNL